MKKLSQSDIIGQQGINLIESICLKIGFAWYPAHLDAGIDGYFEIRDSRTGQMTNLVVQVQSQATERIVRGRDRQLI
jgi:hypothetical protein